MRWHRAAMMDGVLELLTGLGLATSAGLNAYIPLLMIGVLGRFTDMITLPPSWQWLSNGWVIAIISALLLIEVVADKVPVVDHANDIVQTLVRPTSGGLVFGAAATSQTATVTDPSAFFSGNQWVPILIGAVVSFIVHSMKAAARPVVNASTAGFGAPVVSTIEDIFSVGMAIAAILLPALILIFLFVLTALFVRIRRRRRRRKAEQAARNAAAQAAQLYRQGPHDGNTIDIRR